jgi:hypothetical protein
MSSTNLAYQETSALGQIKKPRSGYLNSSIKTRATLYFLAEPISTEANKQTKLVCCSLVLKKGSNQTKPMLKIL